MEYTPAWPLRILASALAAAGLAWLPTHHARAAEPAAPAARQEAADDGVPEQSQLDAPLMYQLLVAEISLNQRDPATAYHLIIDAARQTGDERLFKRAVDIARAAQDGQQALTAARTWRAARPESRLAVGHVAQLLLELDRPAEAIEPLRALINLTAASDRSKVIATVPALLARLPDRNQAAKLIDEATEPYRKAKETSASAWVASGRGWLSAADSPKALDAVKQALAAQPADDAAALLCAELMTSQPEAEALLKARLQLQPDSTAVRLAYTRKLAEASRLAEAADQLEATTKLAPNFAGLWLTLGEFRLDLHQPRAAETALKRYLDERAKAPAESGADAANADDKDDDAPAVGGAAEQADAQVLRAYLLLAQAGEEQGQAADAQQWMNKIPPDARDVELQIRRAFLLARMGKTDQARKLVRDIRASNDDELRSKLTAETALLRDARRWKDAYAVMGEATAKFPDDPDLLYDRALLAEKLDLVDDMEQMLRKVIAIKPNHHNAYNALGFSLADRNLRLDEAKKLIQHALDLSPGDPYIVDSLGWVEFRLGRIEEARKLLQQAYKAKGDTEIGTHLGEVLWVSGQFNEARRIWKEVRQRESGNATLQETLKRLKVTP